VRRASGRVDPDGRVANDGGGERRNWRSFPSLEELMTNGSHDVINPGHHSLFLGIPGLGITAMAPTIPPEIWLRTAKFIPLSTLKTLYSVNPVFLHLALNDMYSEINLAIPWTAATTKYLNHLK